MRLTLRTMLAYLDDILDPADAQDLGHKIEESEFASTLVGRIRDVSRRLRLGAPKLTGRGLGLDPNTVAEYLDNTLSVTRVPEFEKICLESDMHLAEVACSHQILALVLGEPAEVNPASRRRMYTLLPHAQAETFAIAPARDQVEPRYPQRPKAHVPDYLREESSRFSGWMKFVAAILLLAGLSLAVWMAVRPFNRQGTTPIAQRPGEQEGTSPDGTGAQPKSAAGSGSARANAPAADDRDPSGGEAAPAPESAGEARDVSMPAEETGASENRRVEGSIPPAAPQAGDRGDVTGGAPAADQAPPGEATPAAAKSNPASSGEEAIPSPFDGDLPIDAAVPAGEVGPPATAEHATARQPVGRYLSADEVLLTYENDEVGWKRLSGQSALAVGDHLLSLPTFRSTVALSGGVTLQLVGETEIRFEGLDVAGLPEVNIAHGRLVLMSAGRPGAQLRIAVGQLHGTITLVEAASVLGIEVRPTRAEGTDPEKEPPILNVDFFAASGQVLWVDAAQGDPITLTGPQRWSWPAAADEEAGKIDEPWILGEEKIEPIDKRASNYFRENLTNDRPARIQFKELAEDRRVELRSLGVRCLAAIGDFDAVVRSLGDPEKRSGWEEHVDALRRGLAKGPDSAAQVKSSLDRLRPAHSAQLYRMLWGFNDSQLKSGAAVQLVNYLDDNDNLDVRIVAFCTLEKLAGKGLNYRPSDNAKARQASLQKWRKWAQTYEPADQAAPSLQE